MPRWGRKREEEQTLEEELEPVSPEADLSEEPDDQDDEWPDWAIEGRSRRNRSAREKRKPGRGPKKGSRSRTEEEQPAPLFDAESIPDEQEPGVWVSEDPPEIESPVWIEREDQRLRETDHVLTPYPDEIEPAVVVESSAETTSALEAIDPDELAYDSRVDQEEELEGPYSYASDEEYEDAEADPDGEDGYAVDEEYEEQDERGFQPVTGDVVPGGLGPRRAALHERKRKQRTSLAAGLAALLVLVALALFFLPGDGEREDDDPENTNAPVGTQPDDVESMLLYGTREDGDPAKGAAWLTLLSVDRSSDRGSVVYIPAHTAVEVPGRGLLPLGEAAASGDVPLLLVTTEGLLGIEIDRYLELSDGDARVLFEGLGPLEVDVPAEVSVPAGSGQTQLIFTEGLQQVEGSRLSDLLFVTGVEGDDVELGSRHLAFWDALFDTYGDRTAELEEIVLSAEGVLGESDMSPEENAEMLVELAALPEDSMVLDSLPVQQRDVGEGELYSADEAEVQQFVSDTIGAKSSLGTETRVQILNGNGVPGIGEKVADRLVGEGFRVILSGNARTLDYEKTLIITYERTEEGLALAERAKGLIGVGEVQVSGQDQGIVDLTIVVGKDFLGRTE